MSTADVLAEKPLFEEAYAPHLEAVAERIQTEGLELKTALAEMIAGAYPAIKEARHERVRASMHSQIGRAISGQLYRLMSDPESTVTVEQVEYLRQVRPLNLDVLYDGADKYALNYALSAYDASGFDSRHSLAKRYGINR